LYIKNEILEFHGNQSITLYNTECRLNRMGLSQVQGCCHFCKHHIETQQHLFYNCKTIFPVIQYIQTLFFEEDKGTEKGVILGNILIYVVKWTIWKQRNKIKYQNIICKTVTLIRIFKAELKENLILRQKYYNNTSPNIDHITDARSFRGRSISLCSYNIFIHVVFNNIYLYRLYSL